MLGEEPGGGEADTAAEEEEEQQAYLALWALRALSGKLEVAFCAERAARASILASTCILSGACFRRLARHVVRTTLA